MSFLPPDVVHRIRSARNILFLTGAGISSESGIPTFRGDGGYWKTFKAEELATPEAFEKQPEVVWEWYDWRRGICAEAKPNDGHLTIAKWQLLSQTINLITQNVDGLHPIAGSKNLLEIHGNIYRARCTSCGEKFSLGQGGINQPGLKFCPLCESLLRPDIVWFGEGYDNKLLTKAWELSKVAQIVFVIGTSANVSVPTNLALTAIRNGALGIEINPETTSLTPSMQIHFGEKSGEVLPKIFNEVFPDTKQN
ncbi:NAD-dependent deacylase [Leptospira sp. 2 VSF19]|uniref:protein acetyllysine N-acetyltransferase n=1 Tax=Leptospira soteropolitanensis TaxID=2950025 RepID=A0AAW5VLC3_9LEPT|nr:NAD-dependent deacylase [Leptospira soteropolitanensis]MCW7494394.1 NAD-dependent deacylase [Leptospira soteropolitanensis]MCW7501897.1 NAD-dependent deacylase [Leptospira soteropolitanensis]MCW7524240.1 NAD-dependent deacylase [Leptospira soteropolitanensis]MCW7528105.1 NAD-dependent deacylase [Leptospira soteropolitanensis]MCW7531959.1 NAD-dependent deacylase [Leptospira soteropolitanensis]